MVQVLRVGYVPEHFASPLLQFSNADNGKTFTLSKFPGGTGAMTAALQNDEIDVSIALTDALIAGIANGSKHYKLVGSYVASPLNWAVITGKESKFNSLADIRGTPIGISRLGSGSQTMASVMAMNQEWVTGREKEVEKLEFKVNNDLDGLIASVNDGSTSVFMWEWFTTKPYADKGDVRFIGSVLTPWPSWLIAAHPQRADPQALRNFLATLSQHVREFDSPEKRQKENVAFIKDAFGYKEEDIEAWLLTVKYVKDCGKIDGKVIVDTLSILEKAGVVQRPDEGFEIESFVNQEVVRLE